MLDDGDRLLDLVGLALVAVVVLGGALVVLAGLNAGGGGGPPDANWTVVRVNDTHVQVGHVGGEAVDADDLTVTVDGTERPHDWEGEVSRGDAALVRAAPGTTVRLYWTGTPGGDRTILKTWPTPNGSGTATP